MRGDFSFVFSNNQWYHILLTRNSSGSVTLYVNGGVGETITPDYAGGNISNSTGYIGKYWAQTGMNFQGQLSNFQIYNSVLTQSNAATLYNYGVPLMTGAQPQAANLKAWYKLNQTANWEADSTGNWQIPDALSSYPQSFNFNDTTDAINVGGISLGTVHTINFWVNFKPPYGTRAAYILSSGSENGWVVYANNGGTLYYKAGSSQYYSGTMTAPTAAGVGEWHNITITRNGANINFYQNGNTTPFATTSTFAGASTPLGDIDFISADRSYGSSIRYSNFTFYDIEFSPSQVSQIYNNGVPLTSAIATSNLKAWYKLSSNELFDGTNWEIQDQKYPANYSTAYSIPNTNNDNNVSPYGSNSKLISGGSFLSVADSILAPSASVLSISCWVKLDNPDVNFYDNIISQVNGATAHSFRIMKWRNNGTGNWTFGTINFALYSNDTTAVNVNVDKAQFTPQANTWFNIICTYDGTTMRVFINNKLCGSGTSMSGDFAGNTNNRFIIGKNANSIYGGLQGSVSNVQVWNSTLTGGDGLSIGVIKVLVK